MPAHNHKCVKGCNLQLVQLTQIWKKEAGIIHLFHNEFNVNHTSHITFNFLLFSSRLIFLSQSIQRFVFWSLYLLSYAFPLKYMSTVMAKRFSMLGSNIWIFTEYEACKFKMQGTENIQLFRKILQFKKFHKLTIKYFSSKYKHKYVFTS